MKYILGLILAFLITGCGSSKKDSVVIEQFLSGVVMDDISYIQEDRNIRYRSYYPIGLDHGPAIRTYQFNDTAISISSGITTPKLTLNLRDSLYLISINIDYSQIDSIKRNISDLIHFVVSKKNTLAYPTFDSCGISKDMRDWDWVAKFKKKPTTNGLLLITNSYRNNFRFSYFVDYKFTESFKNIPLYKLETLRLPPFIIYSLKDYLKYFGPHEYIEAYPKDVYQARLILMHDYFNNYEHYEYFNNSKYDD